MGKYCDSAVDSLVIFETTLWNCICGVCSLFVKKIVIHSGYPTVFRRCSSWVVVVIEQANKSGNEDFSLLSKQCVSSQSFNEKN